MIRSPLNMETFHISLHSSVNCKSSLAKSLVQCCKAPWADGYDAIEIHISFHFIVYRIVDAF